MSEFYDNNTVNLLRAQADIRTCIPGADHSKATSYVPCPKCGKDGKNAGLCVTHNSRKNLAKCFSCGFALKDALDATMYYQFNEDRKHFAEAVKATADAAGIFIQSENERRVAVTKNHRKQIAKSFCERQLEASQWPHGGGCDGQERGDCQG